MNTVQIVEEVKEVIMKELLVDADDKHCVLDFCIKMGDSDKQQLSKISQEFLTDKKTELNRECNSGKILFFRKYNYEKILIQYLKNKYGICDIEFDLFPSDKKKQELEKRQKQELKEKQYREFEKNIIKQIPYMKWTKTIRVSGNVYMAINEDGKKIELYYVQGKFGKHNKIDKIVNQLTYDNHPLKYVKYDVKAVVDIIEKTCPTNIKADHILMVTRPEYLKSASKTMTQNAEDKKRKRKKKKIEEQKRYNALVAAKEQYINDLIKKYGTNRQEIENCAAYYQNNCRHLNKNIAMSCRFQDRPCTVFFFDCPYNQKFLEMLKNKHEKKKMSQKQREQIKIIPPKEKISDKNKQLLPEIGLKDFVIRVNIFKCMYNQHKIDNVVAMINIDDDGKKKQIKISAGYCSQCKIYFILEFTYQNLKKKGMILCRITDEKNYRKNRYTN